MSSYAFIPTTPGGRPRPPQPSRLAPALLAGVLAGVVLTGCTVTMRSQPEAAPTLAAPVPTATSAGSQPAQTEGASPTTLAAESAAVLAWQDRWYDNFCSSVVVSMADQNCVGIALDAVAFAQGAPQRAAAFALTDALGDDVRAAAEQAAAAADAFVATECDTAQTDECVTPTDAFTDAVDAYGAVLAEAVAAS